MRTAILVLLLATVHANGSPTDDGVAGEESATQDGALEMPFFQEFRQKRNVAEKLEFLQSWDKDRARENGVNYYTFESLVRLNILGFVNAEGGLDCKGLHEKLSHYLYRRHEIKVGPYDLFNKVVDDLCPLEELSTQDGDMEMPFFQEFRQKRDVAEKLEFLQSWDKDRASENEADYFTFDSLVRLNIRAYVNDEGVLDCSSIHKKLNMYLHRRHEITDNAYELFNKVVDDLCPPEEYEK